MRRIEVAASLDELVAFLRESGPPGQTVLLTKGGTPWATITRVDAASLAGADEETVSVSLDPAFRSWLERARAQAAAGLVVSAEEVRQRLSPPEPHRRRQRRVPGKQVISPQWHLRASPPPVPWPGVASGAGTDGVLLGAARYKVRAAP